MDSDEYDAVIEAAITSIRRKSDPEAFREATMFALGVLAEKCRGKDFIIKRLSTQLGKLAFQLEKEEGT